jgi:beta-lactam-binding protein with PASTA domain
MESRERKILRNLRLAGIFLVLVVVLFFLLDDLVMPMYVQQGKTTRVPSVVGMTVAEARKTLSELGLKAKESEYRPDKQYPVGTVVLQNPSADADVKYGRGIYLTISGGEVLVAVPSLRGKSIRDASFRLEQFGLKLGSLQYQPSDELFENTVVSQEIPAGTNVKSGTLVNVIVSQGKTTNRQPVPGVTLKSLAEAEKLILQAGFRVGTITFQVSLDLLPNTVIDQFPRGGELGTLGQPVDLFVAQKADVRTKPEN